MGRAKAVNCPVNEARAEEATGAELGAAVVEANEAAAEVKAARE